MHDVDTQLRDYFEATTPAVEMDEVLLLLERVAPKPVVVRPPRRPLTGWAVAALAVLVVVAAVGGAALLLNATDGDVGPAQTVPGIPTTLATTPISTAPEGSAVALGSGAAISWTQVPGPPLQMQGVVWFGDSFYGLGRSPVGWVLYRSSDGATWESVEGFADAISSGGRADPAWLVTGSDSLMALLSAAPELALDVATSQDGVEWTVARIEVGFSDPPPAEVEASVWPGPAAAGPGGFLVSATVEGTPDHEALIASVYGWDVADDLKTLQVSGDRILFSTYSGSDYEISLSDLGLTVADLTVDEPGARAWWSPDGVTWQSAAREGPMLSPGFGSIVPVSDGFLVTKVGVGLWKTTDGSSWEEVESTYSDRVLLDWNGTPHEFQFGRGSLRPFGSTEELPVSDVIDGGLIDRIAVGEAGFLVVLGQFAAPTQQGEPPVPTLVFSPDGTEWTSWVIEEIVGEGKFVTEVAVGSHRLLALTVDKDGQPGMWVGIPDE
jgi:hypothetical protein